MRRLGGLRRVRWTLRLVVPGERWVSGPTRTGLALNRRHSGTDSLRTMTVHGLLDGGGETVVLLGRRRPARVRLHWARSRGHSALSSLGNSKRALRETDRVVIEAADSTGASASWEASASWGRECVMHWRGWPVRLRGRRGEGAQESHGRVAREDAEELHGRVGARAVPEPLSPCCSR
jgi:hypothetical protein